MTITIYASVDEHDEVNRFIVCMKRMKILPDTLSVHYMKDSEDSDNAE